MLSPQFFLVTKDDERELDAVLKYVEQTIPGTMKLVVATNEPVKIGDVVKVVFGDTGYYLVVKDVGTSSAIFVDLLTYNANMYCEVDTFQSLVTLLNSIVLFPEQSDIYPFIDFNVREGKLIDLLIQCCSHGIYLTALDGSLKIVEIDELYPKPNIELLINTWSIC